MDPEDLLGKNLPYAGGLRLESILGYGSFATVYKAVNKEGQVFAVKWLNKIGMSDRDQALQKDEVMYMKMLGDHKNIIHLYDVIETSDSLFLVLECCTTDLYELITQSEKQLEIPRVKRYFNEICDGVKHCHNNHIYHRDLKPENILISDDDHCKISDFGLCCFDEWTNDFNCGSLRYMSPECIDKEENYDDDDEDDYDDEDSDDNYYGGKKRNEKTGLECNSKYSDVWALGVILINMIFGQNPWSSADIENPTYNMFIRKDPDVLQRKLGLSDEFNRVVKRMFSKNVFDRFSLDELRQEINRIEVFTDYSKRVSNYLGIDDEIINMSNMTMEYSSNEDNSQYDNVDDYDEWYEEEEEDDDYDQNEHVIVPDIDTLELEDEEKNEEKEEEEEEEDDDEPYSFNYMKSNIPVISQWGDDLDDEDIAIELTPRVTDNNEEEEEEEEEEEYSSTKMMTSSSVKSSSYNHDSDVPMSWENRNDSMESNPWKEEKVPTTVTATENKMNVYDYAYENKMKEWKKEEEEDQMESEDNLATPTIERSISFNKNNLFKEKLSLSDKKQQLPVQLRWEDLFDSDEEKNGNYVQNEEEEEVSSPSNASEEGKSDRFKISEQALPSSWNYQQGLSWGDMMDDDDDFMPSKPQQKEEIMTKEKPTVITTAFIEDSNDDEDNDGGHDYELSFKKERVPISSEVSSLVTPSLLTNGMQKKLLSAAKKSHKQEKEKKSLGRNKKGMKEKEKDKDTMLKEKDKETRHHHKSKKDRDGGAEAIKIKTNGKHKHHHHHHNQKSTSSSNEKSSGNEKKSIKLTTGNKHRKNHYNHNHNHKSNSYSIQNNLNSFTNLAHVTHSNDELSITENTPIYNKHTHSSSNSKTNKNKNKNSKNHCKHYKNEHHRKSTKTHSKTKSAMNSPKSQKTNTMNSIITITPIKPSSVQLDWEDLFSSDGEEKTLTTTESTKTNDKSFISVDESLEAEDEVFSLSDNIKALDIENEKVHNNSSTVNKMVDSAISVSETNLSKEIKNLNLH